MNTRSKLLVTLAALTFALASPTYSQTVRTVHNFAGANGQYPQDFVLTQGRDGTLYGMTVLGGAHSLGTVFKQQAGGAGNVVLHSFTGAEGEFPQGGLTLGRDGNFYGTTSGGGASDNGTLFRITPSGSLTVLYSFNGITDGGVSVAPPIQATDGTLYGTTVGSSTQNATVYKFTPSNVFSTIYTFDPNSQGFDLLSPVLQAADGTLYAALPGGGSFNCGSIVQITTLGVLKHKHSLNCSPEGAGPFAPPIQASDGRFYGTADGGGTNAYGTAFRLNPDWTLAVLHNFGSNSTDGRFPAPRLTQGTDGNLYGAAVGGGTDSGGSLFQVTLAGTYTQLYSFPLQSTGTFPEAETALAQHTSGTFYSTTVGGGANSFGNVYTLNMGLGPFVAFVTATGKIGQMAQVLGQGLTGSTAVTFNGVPATSFSVLKDTFMTVVVPAGATTGKVVVTTPGGALTSNVSFRIIQ